MRISIIALLLLVTLSQTGCDGKFDEADLAISLVFPLANEKCEEGIPEANNTIRIPFRWTAQGNFQSFILEIDGEEIPITPESNANGEFQASRLLGYGKQYTWKVKGIEQVVSFESDVRTFTTPAVPENSNYAPYAVILSSPVPTNGSVILNWTAEDRDPNETVQLRFDVFLYTADPITLIEPIQSKTNLASTTTTFQGLEQIKYWVKVEATDPRGNSSSTIITFDGI